MLLRSFLLDIHLHMPKQAGYVVCIFSLLSQKKVETSSTTSELTELKATQHF